MKREIKFTVIAKKWFDKVNGNTYHSVRCVRCEDNAIVVGSFRYGYGEHYKQTALEFMAEAKWLIKNYSYEEYQQRKAEQLGKMEPLTKKIYTVVNSGDYEQENNYPILWTVSEGLKRDCVANGEL